MNEVLTDKKYDKALLQIAKAFYQAYRLKGTVKMKFGVRSMSDSDGNSVVDVYLNALDQDASATFKADEGAKHLQFLESMVPAGLLGYQFILQLVPEGVDEIHLEVLDTIVPATP
jgi:hypothetical protein